MLHGALIGRMVSLGAAAMHAVVVQAVLHASPVLLHVPAVLYAPMLPSALISCMVRCQAAAACGLRCSCMCPSAAACADSPPPPSPTEHGVGGQGDGRGRLQGAAA